jgi:hypothetical protein
MFRETENPIGGLRPTFDFPDSFNDLWQSAFTVLWGLCIIVAIAFLVVSLVKMGKASDDGNPHEHKKGRKSAMWAGGSLIALVALVPIVGFIMWVAG